MFCPKCGSNIPDNSVQCDECGNKFGSANQQNAFQQQTKNAAVISPTVPGKGMGIAAMILGILSIVLFWIPYISLPMATVAVTLGGIGNGKANTVSLKNGCAVAGIATSCVTLGILLTVILLSYM